MASVKRYPIREVLEYFYEYLFVRDVVPGGTRGTQNSTGVLVSLNRGPELAILPSGPRALGPRGGSVARSDRQGAWAALPISLPRLCVWAKRGNEGRTFTAMGTAAARNCAGDGPT